MVDGFGIWKGLFAPSSLLRAVLALCLLVFPIFAYSQPSQPQAGPSNTASQNFVIGYDDTISVTVLRHPEFSGDFLVPRSGIVDLPAAGDVKVIGLSLSDAAIAVRNALKKRLRDPEVSVTLKAASIGRKIYVLGDVKIPGAFDYRPDTTITQALAIAGGLAETIENNNNGLPRASGTVDPADCTVTISRASNAQKISFPLNDVLHGSADKNLEVYPGDTIDIEAVRLISVFVLGEVVRPGAYTLRPDSSGVSQAVALAGGVSVTAATSSITVTHSGTGLHDSYDLTDVLVNGKNEHAPKLQNGDLVVVPLLQARFAVMGFVKLAGVFPLPDGKTIRLSEAISSAQGTMSSRARLGRVAVVNSNPGHEKKVVYNFARFLAKGDTSQNPIITPGDVVFVPETDSIDPQVLFSAIGALATPLILIPRL